MAVLRGASSLIYVKCPECDRAGALLVYETVFERSYFCPDCEHTWEVARVEPGKSKPSM